MLMMTGAPPRLCRVAQALTDDACRLEVPEAEDWPSGGARGSNEPKESSSSSVSSSLPLSLARCEGFSRFPSRNPSFIFCLV